MLSIEKKESKPLLEREEIYAIVKSKVTPSLTSVQEEIANKLEKKKELVVVKNVYQRFGKQEASVVAYVYDSEEALKKFEPKKKEKKAKVEEKK
jgi:ribosomal protein S24E